MGNLSVKLRKLGTHAGTYFEKKCDYAIFDPATTVNKVGWQIGTVARGVIHKRVFLENLEIFVKCYS